MKYHICVQNGAFPDAYDSQEQQLVLNIESATCRVLPVVSPLQISNLIVKSHAPTVISLDNNKSDQYVS